MGYVKVERTCEENEDHTEDYCAACSTCHECLEEGRELTDKAIKKLELELHEYKSLCSQLQEELKEAGLNE